MKKLLTTLALTKVWILCVGCVVFGFVLGFLAPDVVPSLRQGVEAQMPDRIFDPDTMRVDPYIRQAELQGCLRGVFGTQEDMQAAARADQEGVFVVFMRCSDQSLLKSIVPAVGMNELGLTPEDLEKAESY